VVESRARVLITLPPLTSQTRFVGAISSSVVDVRCFGRRPLAEGPDAHV
jgi:hypothetical protein